MSFVPTHTRTQATAITKKHFSNVAPPPHLIASVDIILISSIAHLTAFVAARSPRRQAHRPTSRLSINKQHVLAQIQALCYLLSYRLLSDTERRATWAIRSDQNRSGSQGGSAIPRPTDVRRVWGAEVSKAGRRQRGTQEAVLCVYIYVLLFM